MDDCALNLMEYIHDKDYLRNYLYMLTGVYELDNYSSYANYIHRLCQILEYSREHKNMVLLDDLRWGGLDSKGRLYLIDTLFEHAIHNEGVVLTGCDQKGLVKSRTYNSKIIDL